MSLIEVATINVSLVLPQDVMIIVVIVFTEFSHRSAIYMYGGQPSLNDQDNPGMGISVPCPGEEINGTLNCPGIQVNSVSIELFYT